MSNNENYGHFVPWLVGSKSVRSNQKLDCSTQVTEFGLAVDERTRNNLYARWSKLTWSSLEQSNHGAK